MSEQSSTLLGLPYVMPDQAQKHVTINESLRTLDALVQLSVAGLQADPPALPADGARYMITSQATGVWAGNEDKIAGYVDGAWQFHVPQAGWVLWDQGTSVQYVFDNAVWTKITPDLQNISTQTLGINAQADSFNRLSLSASASLLNHEGGDHRLTINRNTATDTASLVFQTDFSGTAEFGILGNSDFQIKTSLDGSNWNTPFAIKTDTGYVGIGLTNPTATLDIQSQQASFVVQRLRASTGSSAITFTENGTNNYHLQMKNEAGQAQIQIHTEGKSFLNGGDLGIGTTTPSCRLQVEGAVRVAEYTPATLPSALSVGAGAIIYVVNTAGTPGLAVSNGTDWYHLALTQLVS